MAWADFPVIHNQPTGIFSSSLLLLYRTSLLEYFHCQISHCTAPPAGTFSCHACSCSQLTIFIWKSSIMLREQVVILHVILQTAKLPLIKTNHKVFFNLKKIPLVEWGRSYPPHSLNTLVLPTVLRRFLSFSFYTLVILFSYR